MRPPFLLRLALALACLAPAAHVRAAGQWGGSISSDWFTPANWGYNTVPGSGDSVYVFGVVPVQISSPGAVAQGVAIGYDGVSANQLIVTGGGTLTTVYGMEVATLRTTGRLDITAGGQVNLGGGLSVGATGQTVTSVASGQVNVIGAGSRLTVNSDITLGLGSDSLGDLTVADGGFVHASVVRMTFYSYGNQYASVYLNGTAGARGVIETGQIIEGAGNGAFINFDGGILRATSDQAGFIQDFDAGHVRLLAGGGFIDTQGYNVGMNTGAFDGVGALTKLGSGSLRLTGTNTYAGGTTITGGLIEFDALANFGSGSINLDGGGLRWSTGNTTDVSARIGAFGANGTTFDPNGNDITLAFAFSGAGSVTATGAGTLTLTGANTYTGGTVVAGGGTLVVGGAPASAGVSALGSQSGALTVNGTLDLHGFNQGAGQLTGTGTILNQVNGTARTLTVGHADAPGQFDGVIADHAGGGATGTVGLTKTGTGTLTLTNDQTYTGATTIAGGTLRLANVAPALNATLGATTLWLEAGTGVTLTGGTVTGWTDLSSQHNDATARGGTVTLGTTNNGLPAVFFDGGSSLASPASTSAGAYTVFAIIQPANLSSVGTILGSSTNGNLQLRLGFNQLNLLSQGIADLGWANGGITADNAQMITALTTSGAQNYYLGSTPNGTGAASYTFLGGGTALIGANSDNTEDFTGGLSALLVFNSTLTSDQIASVQRYLNWKFFGGLSANGSLSSQTPVSLTAAGAALDLNGRTQSLASLAGVTGTAVYLGNGALTVGGANTSTTFAGGLADTDGASSLAGGSLTKIGSGTLTLTGVNTYTGATAVNAGTLRVNGSLTSSAVTVNSGATLGGSGTIGGLTTFNSGAHLAPGNSPGTLTFTGGLTLNGGAILDFQLGTISDLIAVTGGTLTGPTSGLVTLNLSNAGGFTAGTYTLINYASASGTSQFGADSFALGSTISGYTYNLNTVNNTLQLTATASAIPEPSTYAALAGLGALGLAIVCRRRRATA